MPAPATIHRVHDRPGRVRRGATIVALGTAAAIVYATLYPFEGWRTLGALRAPGLAFLADGWPRYWTAFDVALNVVMYLPLGGAVSRALRARSGVRLAVAAGAIAGATLSFTLEWLQNLVPARVPSNLDLAANSVGACLGAVAGALIPSGRVRAARTHTGGGAAMPIVEGGSASLLVLAIWLAAQFHPQATAFATGDLRAPIASLWPALADWLAQAAFASGNATLVEAIAVALAMAAAGALLIDALRAPIQPLAPLVLFFATAITIKTVGTSWLLDARPGFGWLSAGTQGGIVVGALLLVVLSWMTPPARLAGALVALAVGTAFVNLAPPNEYYAARLAAWDRGRWEHVAALLRALSLCWPSIAATLVAWRLRSRPVYNRRDP